MKKDTMTYAKAIARLEEIVQKLETGETSVDELGAAVKEGVELVRWCRQKLRTTEQEVEKALSQLETDTAAPSERRAEPVEPDDMDDPFKGLFSDD